MKAGKAFFSEEKKQKTFIRLGTALLVGPCPLDERFFGSFF
jgi:hypothetical protein